MYANTSTGIYTIQSPSGKIYVGQSRDIKQRIAWYKKARAKNQQKLYHSLLKYGWDAHEFIVILTLKPDISQEQLNFWEQFFMDYYRGEGYTLLNIREAGSKGKTSEETKKKMNLAAKGKPKSEAHKLNLRLSRLGKSTSEETKMKLSLKMTGRKRTVEHQNKLTLSQIGRKKSEETKRKISEAKKGQGLGKKLTAEHIYKASIARIGQKRSEESKRKMSEAHKGKPWSELRRNAQNKKCS